MDGYNELVEFENDLNELELRIDTMISNGDTEELDQIIEEYRVIKKKILNFMKGSS